MRGAVSLAIALSVPTSLAAVGGVAGRDEVVFVTAGVILLSLLVQGPLLPAFVRWARIPVDHAADEEYELAERAISGAALAALDDLAAEHGIGQEVRDRVRAEGYLMLELANAKSLAREQAIVDAEARALDDMLDEPDPLGGAVQTEPDSGGGAGLTTPTDAAEGVTLQMLATSTDVDLLQRSPLVRHEEHSTLKLALLDRKREVLLGLRRSGTVDDLIVRRISARLDLEQVRLQGIEEFD
jgi:CPA1 family monovalent cation:H+ antiporter